jgi:HEAT repeat protein
MARGVLRELGRAAPVQLLDMAQNSRPSLTREIIKIIKELANPRISPRLASFLNASNPDIRKSAIEALGHLRDPKSVRLLAACIQDRDKSTRILAIRSLKGTDDEAAIARILSMLKEKTFHYLSRAEKQAVIEFLAAISSQQSVDTLGSLLRKVGRFSRPKVIETGLLTISALGKSGNPMAKEALDKISRSSHTRLKKKYREIRREAEQR